MCSNIMQRYLDTPPYFGASSFADKERVKAAAGSTCCFDREHKLWGTRQLDCLIALVRSGRFQPFGIDPEWNDKFLEAAKAFAVAAEAAWIAQNAPPAPTPAAWLSGPKRVRAATRPRGAVPAAAPAAAAPAATAPKREGGIAVVAPTAAELAECARLGFTREAIAYSTNCDELGPRGTLSDAGRVLRWCLVLTSGAEIHAYEGTDDPGDFYYDLEVGSGVRGAAGRFDAARVAKLSEAAHRKFAARLADRCRGLAVSSRALGA